ncbi:glycosyltransferase [Aquipuribacter hungaricus]|uniref:Glycosyltransferase n=1 Tax=Aquipuribacter hungaricus TaxID=545624 RepID=A0ABV7WGK9_9MICO
MTGAPEPSFAHLVSLTDAGGLYEHALGTRPRPEHGYCVDDVARGLVVTARQPDPAVEVVALRRQYLDFVLAAGAPDGRWHNRRTTSLRWADQPTTEDCWGRALWGLGAVVGAPPGSQVPADEVARALAGFGSGARQRSVDVRADAFAALGAADVLRTHPDHAVAHALLTEVADRVWSLPAPDGTTDGWRWPEARLRYANAVLPEVLLAAGARLGRPDLTARGLDLLGWLLQVQTHEGHLSVVPVAGRGPGDVCPGFDQQPIEVAALADACALAHESTGEARWADAVRLAAAWFTGDNDIRTPLLDPVSGGGCDGLHADRRNENQGAESTLALVSTLQQAARLRAATAGGPGVRTVVAGVTAPRTARSTATGMA